jgi:hypothetical protein
MFHLRREQFSAAIQTSLVGGRGGNTILALPILFCGTIILLRGHILKVMQHKFVFLAAIVVAAMVVKKVKAAGKEGFVKA